MRAPAVTAQKVQGEQGKGGVPLKLLHLQSARRVKKKGKTKSEEGRKLCTLLLFQVTGFHQLRRYQLFERDIRARWSEREVKHFNNSSHDI